jgi:hypothetical protein
VVGSVPYRSEPSIAGFDAAAAVEVARSTAGEDLLVAVEYDRESFATLYAADALVTFYGGEAAMREQFQRIHSFVNLDFMERDVITDVFRGTGTPRAFTTYTDRNALVRLLAEDSGLFLGLEPAVEVTAVVEAVEAAAFDR